AERMTSQIFAVQAIAGLRVARQVALAFAGQSAGDGEPGEVVAACCRRKPGVRFPQRSVGEHPAAAWLVEDDLSLARRQPRCVWFAAAGPRGYGLDRRGQCADV